MLIVTVTLIPAGFQPLRRDIGTLRIANVSDLAPVSDYEIHVIEAANPLTGARAKIGVGTLEGHARAQSIWALVERAAAAALSADLIDL